MTKPNPCKKCGEKPKVNDAALKQVYCQCNVHRLVRSDRLDDAILGWNAMNPVAEPEKVEYTRVESITVQPESCGSCLFFTGKVCRRFPPVGTHDNNVNYTIWPSVTAGQWCGEWRAK